MEAVLITNSKETNVLWEQTEGLSLIQTNVLQGSHH